MYLQFSYRYRVFLGHKQYFVSSDVGGGKMQWYAFHNEPPGGVDVSGGNQSPALPLIDSRFVSLHVTSARQCSLEKTF